MAATTNVEIRGKQTVSDAAKQAGDSLRGLNTATESTSSVFDKFTVTAGDVVGAFKSIASEVAQLVTAYAENERAALTYSAAMRQSKQISDEGADALLSYASAMALKTGADDEDIMGMISYLTTAGRTEDQIRKMISAASDMSVVTGKDLRTSIEELNRTFSGTEGRIGQLIPDLKDLSEEELRNGDAIEIIAAKYKGLADGLSGSTDVALKNAKNAFDDLRAAVGGQLADAVTPILRKVTEYINDDLIPVIENLPEVIKLTMELAGKIIDNTFSSDGIKKSIAAIGAYLVAAFRAAFEYIPLLFIEALKLLISPIVTLGKYLADTISKAMMGAFSEIESPFSMLAEILSNEIAGIKTIGTAAIGYIARQVENVKPLGGDILSISDEDIKKYLAEVEALKAATRPTTSGGTTTATGGRLSYIPETGDSKIDDYLIAQRDLLSKSAGGLTESIVGYLKRLEESIKTGLGMLGFGNVRNYPMGVLRSEDEWPLPQGRLDTVMVIADRIEKRLIDAGFLPKDLSLPEPEYFDLMEPVEPMTKWPRGVMKSEGTTIEERGPYRAWAPWPEEKEKSPLEQFISSVKENVKDTEVGGGLFNNLANIIGSVVGSLGSFIVSLSSVNAILNPLQTVFGAMFDVLAPLINTILAPIVGILRVIGTTLGQVLAPVFSAFGPIITTLAMGFAWLYNNVILPFGNSIIFVGNAIYNGIVTAINAMLGWIGVHFDTIAMTAGMLKEINLADITTAGATSGSVSTAGGKAAQYSGGTINYVTVTVNTSALVGTDGVDEFSIMIGNRLRAAGVLGRA